MKPVAESYFWIQGGLVPEHEAKLSPLDQGFNVGDGVYETLRAYKGKPFSLIRHWNRLEKSCKKIYVQSPTYSAFKMMIEQTLEANQLEDARVRVTVSSGAGPFGSARSSREPTVVCAVSPAPQYDATARVVVVPWTRNEGGALAGIKTLSHGENVMGLQHARQRGASEAVFANTRGDLCEGATSNIFAVHGGRLTTPTLGSGCLPGVTRELVLELCAAHDISVEEADVPATRLQEADEAFLTSCTRQVQPISHVDGQPLSQCPGPRGQRLSDLLRKLISEHTEP